MREYSISKRLIEGYLHQPYVWFLNRHSGDLGKTILSEVGVLIQGTIIPCINVISQILVTIALIGLLLMVNFTLTLLICGVLGLSYGLIYLSGKNFLNKIGQERLAANEQRFIVVNEAFGAVKEIKVARLEDIYIHRFSQPAEIYAKNQTSSIVISQIPRFAIEMIAFGGILLITLFLLRQSSSFDTVFPLLSLYAFVGYRLMPAIQQIYHGLSSLNFSKPTLISLHADLMSLKPHNQSHLNINELLFKKKIELKNISFSYPNANNPTLNKINITIPLFSKIGLVGATGSGKTTTVDLVLGLLEPQEGNLIVDGVIIDKFNCHQWQKFVGYVPQQIYLADDTIAANIAFGIGSENINQAQVEKVAKLANLHDFVLNGLSNGYDTKVGERGVRLSGGQKQRIGIARALYHNPKLLVLDEATNALDNLTERAVMEAIDNLGEKITIVIIAHRLDTVKNCDQIYILKKGRVMNSGKYDELLNSNKDFFKMAIPNNNK